MEKFPSSSRIPKNEKLSEEEKLLRVFYTQEHPTAGLIGKEKSNRFLSLAQVRELVGNLTSADEKEYQDLVSEIRTAQKKGIEEMAGTADSIAYPEYSADTFTDDDISKWQEGAQVFEHMSVALQEAKLKSVFEKIFDPVDTNALKALFLKEKPAILLEESIDSTDPAASALIKMLESFNIQVSGKYIYDAEQVRGVIRMHPDIFSIFESTDADEIMRKIADKKSSENHSAVGLLLGFPLESVKNFNNERGERHPVNIYGVQWADSADSSESKIKQLRLKTAFEKSGILKMGK